MDEQHSARRSEVALRYNGVDISADLAPFLISFTYTDNASDKADDLSVVLEDREGLWRDPWFPDKGATVEASIITRDWEGAGTAESLPLGLFEIDQIECSGPPTTVTIKCVSTLCSKPMRLERKTRGWERVTLRRIAQDIAARNGLELFWDSDITPFRGRWDQVEQSDLAYLQGLCRTYRLGIKVSDSRLIIYDEKDYETRDASGALVFGDGSLKSYRFSTKTNDTYSGARLSYHDPVKDVTYEAEVLDDMEGTGRMLTLNQFAEDDDDAELQARQELADRNKRECTASVTLVGTARYEAGKNVDLRGWGRFDGKYFIEKATHSIGGSGYVTTLSLRRGEKKKSGGGARETVRTDMAEGEYYGV